MEVAAWFALFLALPPPPDPKKKDLPVTSLASPKTIFGVERRIDIDDKVFPTDEQLVELEKGMEGCEHGWMESCFEGAQLHYRKWVPSGTTPKGIIVWLHGIAAHSGRSLVLGDRKLGMALQCERWIQEGYALYALDYYGHGYSEGCRFFVPSYTVNRDDIVAFCQKVAGEHKEGTPLFLEAESYGGCLALHVAKIFQDSPEKGPKGFRGIILQAPAIIPPDLPPKPVVAFLTRLASSYPTWVPFFMPNPVSTTRIWKDEAVRKVFDSKERREMNIEGGGKPFRLATAVAMLEAMELVREEIIPNLTVPFCVIHGEQDIAVPISGTELLVQTAKTRKDDQAVQRHPEAFHDLMADPTVEKTMEFMLQFVNQRVAANQ
jgi:alpha-beta hydrolase superfamily lysophospholipase